MIWPDYHNTPRIWPGQIPQKQKYDLVVATTHQNIAMANIKTLKNMAWSNTTTHENMVLSYASTHKNMAWSDITIKKNISLVRYHNTQVYGLVRLPQHTRIQPERSSTTHRNMTGQIPQHVNIYPIRYHNTPEYDLVRPPQHTRK
jgi:hypothetical protein